MLAAMLLACGPALSGVGGLTLACKGTTTSSLSASVGLSPSDASGSVVIEAGGKRLHSSFAPFGPCAITKATPTTIDFECAADKREGLYDQVGGYLNRISGDLWVLLQKGALAAPGSYHTQHHVVCMNAAPLF